LRLDGRYDSPRNLVLHREDVADDALMLLGPDLVAARSVDKTARYAKPFAASAHAALEDVAHTQLLRDHPVVEDLALVGKGRVSGDDRQPEPARQAGNDVFDDPIGEVLLIGVGAQVGKR